MAEMKNTEKQNIGIQKEEEKEKLESVKKADAAVKSMHDFTSPEVLYEELIKSVRKYHPSADISMIEKAYKVASEAHKDQKRKSGEPYIILSVWQSSWQILSWIRRPLWQVFFMMQWKIPG